MKSAWPADYAGEGPVEGLKVMDLSTVLAGPYAGMLLGDLGADVIKVERPQGDVTRSWGPPFLDDTAVYFLAINRNKRSIVLDLHDPDARRAAQQLALEADVILENFRPGRAEDFGLGYHDVRAANPRCVYCSITSFGSDSPTSERPAYDLVVQALGGIMGITGAPDQAPVKVGVASADLATGMYATIGILSALWRRASTGEGRHIEVALMDSQVAGLANQAMNWLAAGFNPPRLGSDHPNIAPYGAFATRVGYLVVAIGNDHQFRRLAAALDSMEWTEDERFATNPARVAHNAELRERLEDIFSSRPADVWVDILESAGVPCGLVRDVKGVFADRTVFSRLVRTVDHPRLGRLPQVLSPFRFDGSSVTVTKAPPDLGADTDVVLEHLRRVARNANLDQAGGDRK